MQSPRQVEIRTVGWWFPATLLAAGLVAMTGITAWFVAEPSSILLIVALTAAVLAAVLLTEWPWRVTFDVDGVERRSLLRRHRIPWGEIDSLERLPGLLATSVKALSAGRRSRQGLAVRTVRGGIYILSATTESIEQRRALQAAVTQWAPYCRINLLR